MADFSKVYDHWLTPIAATGIWFIGIALATYDGWQCSMAAPFYFGAIGIAGTIIAGVAVLALPCSISLRVTFCCLTVVLAIIVGHTAGFIELMVNGIAYPNS